MLKKFHGVLLGISSLSILAVLPAMAETITERRVVNSEDTLNWLGLIASDIDSTGQNGGAICSAGDLTLVNGEFSGNHALNGGAIYNTGTLTIENGTFSDNHADGTYTPNSGGTAASYSGGGGGAIYNNGTLTVGGTFANNTGFSGGAIRNLGTLTVSDSSYFNNNYANVAGGAIYNTGTLEIGNNVIFNNNRSFIAPGDLDVSSGGSEMGAAIYSEGTASSQKLITMGNGVKFTNNSSYGGTLYLFGSNDVTIGDNLEFSGNTGTAAASIRTSHNGSNGPTTMTIGDNAVFRNNTVLSGTGGAAITMGNSGDDISIGENAIIADNTGSAIWNSAGTLSFGSNLTVTGNVANAITGDNWSGIGAFIKNMGPAELTLNGGTFANNTADVAGGVIYNYSSALVTLNGESVFTGNTAGGVANDIYNNGTVVFAEDSVTTMDGGIKGNGSVNIEEGATLNLGTASIVQGSMDLSGILNATLKSEDDFAWFNISTSFGGDGILNLDLRGEGEYTIFEGEIFDNENITISSTIFDYEWNDDFDTITVTMKSVEDIAGDNGLTSDTAQTIANLVTSTSGKLNDFADLIQDGLAAGNTDAVEHAHKAIHPETESVVQSVSTSVQNAIANLAAGRMAGLMGRSGGAAPAHNGVWVEGMYNKSKQNDAFNGYTRGIVAGVDTQIMRGLMLGAGYSYAHSDISAIARNTEIDSNTIFVYGQYKPTAWYMNAMANYTMSDYSEKSDVLGVAVKSDFDVDALGAAVMTGYDFAGGITPELGLRYMHISADEYKNSLGVKSKLGDSDYLTAVLGTKYAFDYRIARGFTLRPELRYAVKWDIVSDKSVATITMPGVNSYVLDGNRLSRIGAEFGGGLVMKYGDLSLALNYDIEVREGYTSQTGRVRARMLF